MKAEKNRSNEITAVFLRKVHSAIERPRSYLALKQAGYDFDRSISYNERRVILELLPCLKRTINVVYDIGAHRGDYLVAMSKLPSIQSLIGFEPIPSCYEIACEATKHDQRISLFNCALGPENTSIVFNLNDSDASSSALAMRQEHKELFPHTTNSQGITVLQRRLDDLVTEQGLPNPDLIVMDVQGYEGHVIEGGNVAFHRAGYLLIELSFIPLYEGGPLAAEMILRLSNAGWRIIRFSEPLIDNAGRWISANCLFERVIKESSSENGGAHD